VHVGILVVGLLGFEQFGEIAFLADFDELPKGHLAVASLLEFPDQEVRSPTAVVVRKPPEFAHLS